MATGVFHTGLAALQTPLSLNAPKLVEVCQTHSDSFPGVDDMVGRSDRSPYNDPARHGRDAEIAACVAHGGCAVSPFRSDQRDEWAMRIRPNRSAVETAQ